MEAIGFEKTESLILQGVFIIHDNKLLPGTLKSFRLFTLLSGVP
ncbi:hypothetical protein TRIP_B350160 [uncultured Desulfatiglans sp.]|uniref:Uncharacterized protein n=1 Tax=Uncultured Desulfatiglans sp. TaxID=1748965 RepID=A0A653AAB8_UNCDX|nr:hypothetical protein TRIP_B350160 [uncultured Desulfatiglans sp.]